MDIRSSAPSKEYKDLHDYQIRVLLFDPTEVYARVKVNHYKRLQSIPIALAFPQVEKGVCACGCKKPLTGRRRRWATDSCQYFAVAVVSIIGGHPEYVSRYLRYLFESWACHGCGVMDVYNEYSNGIVAEGIQKDHVVAVTNGGGGCWLSNYQLLCPVCHKHKTRQDLNPVKQ